MNLLGKTELIGNRTILVNCCKANLRRKYRVILLRAIPEGSYDDVFHVKDEQLDLDISI